MRGHHRSRPAAPYTVKPSDEDIKVAFAWGLKLTEWYALTDFERAECRRNVTTAPYFEEFAA